MPLDPTIRARVAELRAEGVWPGDAIGIAAFEQRRKENPVTDNVLAARFAETAAGHRRLAEAADSLAERRHWTAEAIRFDDLADLARTDWAAARAAYRPTRSFEED